MATVQYGVTENGFVAKPVSAILASLNTRFQAAFGTTFDVSPESPDGQTIGIVADDIAACWAQAEQVFNAYRPGSVQGVGLDNICELTNTQRYVDRHSRATVELTGAAGSLVPAGSIVSDGNREFVTQTPTTIPGDVTVVASLSGEYYIAPNTINKIVSTGISGWTGVNNPDVGETGIIYESDVALRSRRDRTTAIAGSATVEAIYAALSGLNLSYIRVRDNDTGSPIGAQPSGTIFVVVDGGTKNDIASRIYAAKTGGVPTFGTEDITITDSKGYPHHVKFSRSTPQEIFVKGTFKRRANSNISSNDAATALQGALAAYLNNLSPGDSVIWSSLFAPLSVATSGIEVVSLFIGIAANPTHTDSIALDIDKRAHGTAANITFTDVTNTP